MKKWFIISYNYLSVEHMILTESEIIDSITKIFQNMMNLSYETISKVLFPIRSILIELYKLSGNSMNGIVDLIKSNQYQLKLKIS